MKKIKITGEMWNDLTAIQDRLVMLHNALIGKPFSLTWGLHPGIASFHCNLFRLSEDNEIDECIDGCKCYVDCEIDGSTINDVMNKIAEWEERYGLE